MNKKDWIYFIIVGICVVLLIVIIIFMKSETTQCVKNPFVYGASNMKNVECYCTQTYSNQVCPAKFSFNDTAFKIERTECGY